MRTRDIKARAEELLDGYEDAYNQEFNEQFRDFITSEEHILKKGIITEDDIQGFMDSFTFPDEDEWAFDEVQSELDDIGDAKYEQMREERCGL